MTVTPIDLTAASAAAPPSSPAAAAASASRPRGASPPRARASSSPTSTPTPGRAAAEEVDGTFVRTDVADEGRRRRAVRRRRRDFGAVDIAFNNAGISPPDDDSIETTELDAWDRVQLVNLTSVYLCCRAALRHMVPARPRLDHQHGVVRRGARQRDLADLVHRVEGRRARHEPRARRAVRAAGHPRERALPGPGEHAAAEGAVREGPRARRPPSRARARSAASPSRRSSPPRSPSSPPTTPPSSPGRPSSSTAASPPPTSRRCERDATVPARTPRERAGRRRGGVPAGPLGQRVRGDPRAPAAGRPARDRAAGGGAAARARARRRGSASAATCCGRRSARSPTRATSRAGAAATAAPSCAPTSSAPRRRRRPRARASSTTCSASAPCSRRAPSPAAASRTLSAEERDLLWSRLLETSASRARRLPPDRLAPPPDHRRARGHPLAAAAARGRARPGERAARRDPADRAEHRALERAARGDRAGGAPRRPGRGPAAMREHLDGTAALLRAFLEPDAAPGAQRRGAPGWSGIMAARNGAPTEREAARASRMGRSRRGPRHVLGRADRHVLVATAGVGRGRRR